MKKLAVYVEGYTEVLFVSQLVEEIAGANNVRIEQLSIRGGVSIPKKITIIRAAKPDTGQQYYVLVVDCGNDKLVKERIREDHQSLTNAQYSKVIGLRDVYPDFSRAEVSKLEQGLRSYIKTSLIPVDILLGIMEVEAWFLAEHTHFERIDAAITIDAIRNTLGFDPSQDDIALRDSPAKDLDDCYGIGGKRYKKGETTCVNALDYTLLYAEIAPKVPYLKRFIAHIETFLD